MSIKMVYNFVFFFLIISDAKIQHFFGFCNRQGVATRVVIGVVLVFLHHLIFTSSSSEFFFLGYSSRHALNQRSQAEGKLKGQKLLALS